MHFKSTKHQIFFSVTALYSCSPALLKMSKRKSGICWRHGRRFFYCTGRKALFKTEIAFIFSKCKIRPTGKIYFPVGFFI